MEKSEEISKEELIKRAEERGYFKNESVQAMYARTNGHFYYSKPPQFADGHATIKITREDVSGTSSGGSDVVEYPFNQKDTVAMIKGLENASGIDVLIEEGKLLKEDSRKGVLKALQDLEKKGN